MTVVDEIIRLFDAEGHTAYHGEAVSQTAHALQSAYQADCEGAPAALVIAALLHDVGHLLNGYAEDDVAERGLDDRHEDEGAAWLAHHFGPDVVAPIRLHVAAKRYLCARHAAYRERLSPASLRSLAIQGGLMSQEEIDRFQADPHFRDALRLRGWDDAAKIPGQAVPGLTDYVARLETLLLARTDQ
jgi:phosphonate degradation associated HDIG domain protein